MANAYYKTELTGGGADALDFMDGDSLSQDDLAFVSDSDISYRYILNATSGAAESSPDIISPDTNAGTKRWILQPARSATVTNEGIVELATDAETITGTDTTKVVTPSNIQAKIANDTEAEAKTLTTKVISPANLGSLFLDEDNLVSDSATKLASQQSIKAYVETYVETYVDTNAEISDIAFASSWDTVSSIAPSKNAVYDEIYQVTKAPVVISDNNLIRGDGGSRNIQESTISVSDDGEMVNASQPCFLVEPSVDQNNLSVDTNHTVVFDIEVFDVGGNFASNTFTAPVTGKYQFNCNLNLQGIDSGSSFISFKLVTSNRTITHYYEVSGPSTLNYVGIAFSVLTDMDLNDTAYLQLYVGGGSATTDIKASSNFSGFLVC